MPFNKKITLSLSFIFLSYLGYYLAGFVTNTHPTQDNKKITASIVKAHPREEHLKTPDNAIASSNENKTVSKTKNQARSFVNSPFVDLLQKITYAPMEEKEELLEEIRSSYKEEEASKLLVDAIKNPNIDDDTLKQTATTLIGKMNLEPEITLTHLQDIANMQMTSETSTTMAPMIAIELMLETLPAKDKGRTIAQFIKHQDAIADRELAEGRLRALFPTEFFPED